MIWQFLLNMLHPRNLPIEKNRFLRILWYKSKLRFWFSLNFCCSDRFRTDMYSEHIQTYTLNAFMISVHIHRWRIHTCAMTHCTCAPWLIHSCAMTHSTKVSTCNCACCCACLCCCCDCCCCIHIYVCIHTDMYFWVIFACVCECVCNKKHTCMHLCDCL